MIVSASRYSRYDFVPTYVYSYATAAVAADITLHTVTLKYTHTCIGFRASSIEHRPQHRAHIMGLTPWQIMAPDQSVVVDRGAGRFSRRSRCRKPTASHMDSSRVMSRVRDGASRTLLATLPLLPCRALHGVSTMVAPAGALWSARSGLRWGALGA